MIDTYLLFLAIGYLFGSVPFGLLITRFGGQGDVRDIGSGNIGATNVLRTGSKKLAVATLLADVLKGTIPVLIGYHFSGTEAAAAAGFGSFIGHNFPMWLKFKGGKGVATYLGVLFGFFWPLALIFIVTWLVTAYFKKISSLSALVGSYVASVAGYFLSGLHMALFVGLMTVIIFITHRDNIKRLYKGTESKISFGSSKSSSA